MFKQPWPRALSLTAIKVAVMSAISIFDLLYVAQYVPVKVHVLVATLITFFATFLFGELIFTPVRLEARRVFKWIVGLYLWEALLTALAWIGLSGNTSALFNPPLGQHAILFGIYTAAMFAAWYDVKRLGGNRFSEGLM